VHDLSAINIHCGELADVMAAGTQMASHGQSGTWRMLADFPGTNPEYGHLSSPTTKESGPTCLRCGALGELPLCLLKGDQRVRSRHENRKFFRAGVFG
jgi:hypothetical protein